MYCPYCGKEVSDNMNYGNYIHCFYCGIDVEIINHTEVRKKQRELYEQFGGLRVNIRMYGR
jgi:DNA-directed RNA polymerase subunit RPC12/RpoP